MSTLTEKIVFPLVSVIPWRVRNRLYRLPGISGTLRRVLNRLLAAGDEVIPVTISAGPLKGFRLEIKFQSEKFFWLGTHEPRVQEAIVGLVKEGGTAYDIGTYIGFFTLLLSSRVGPAGRVIACEPNPDSYQRLVRNLRLNRAGNATCLNLAADETTGEKLFRPEEDGTPLEGHLLDPGAGTEAGGLLRVRTAALDDLVFRDRLPAPDFVKIDVEGSEARVLGGMSRILTECRPVVICEVHDHPAARAVGEILGRHRYAVSDLEGRREVPGQGPRRRYFLARPGGGREDRVLT